jgi:hypothetical protein
MDRFQLGQFQLTRNPNSDDLLLLVTESQVVGVVHSG